MVAEVKYVDVTSDRVSGQVVRELQDYLSVASETTSDWGHDFGFGFVYNFNGNEPKLPKIQTSAWQSHSIYVLTLQ